MSTISSPLSSSSSHTPSTSTVSPTSYFQALARRRQQKKMSITQTYYLAHTARKKLTREASRSDHDLRLLVGHANLLDSLMLDLADAEQEQERWFNQTVSGASKSSPSDAKHIQWAETVVEDPEEDWDPEDISDEDSDLFDEDEDDDDDDDDNDEEDDSDLEDEDGNVRLEELAVPTPIVRKQVPSPVTVASHRELPSTDEEYESDPEIEYDDGEEDLEGLTLTRVPSRQSPPPDLSSDSDGESEDDAMPPSPPQPTFEFSDEKEPHSTTIPLADTDQPSLFEQGYYVPNPSQGAIIEAY